MIRYSVLVGVSTDAQAREDKLSIPQQLEYTRQRLQQVQGAVETAGPYIMDGYTRSGYDSLDLALRDIPPLAAAIHDAAANRYDVLVMDNYDRLGDLAVLVKTRFKKLRKQLHSVRQSGPIQPPETYDPYTSDDVDIAMYVQGIIQTYRINKIRRGWTIGVPSRAANGLHPLSIPFGYRLTARGQPAQPVDDEAHLLHRMAAEYLAGRPLQSICDLANQSGVTPPRAKAWTRITIKRLLLNPYYAGITVYGRTDHRQPVPPSQWSKGQGRHTPLWDETYHQKILAETERRDSLRMRSQTYPLSGLLTCNTCQTRIHRHGSNGYHYLTCRHKPPCFQTRYQPTLEAFASAFTEALTRLRTAPPAHTDETIAAALLTEQTRRQRIQEGYEQGLYTAAEARTHIIAIETAIEKLHHQQTRQTLQTEQRNALHTFAQQDLTRLTHWILHDHPATVNHLLTTLCQTVTATPDLQFQFHWR